MKILLAYSKAHFDPQKKPSEHKYWGSSANILSKSLYEILSDLGEVTYIDSWHREETDSVEGQSFDLFVGIIDKFAEVSTKIDCPKKILFAVNSHPTFRNKQLEDFLERENLTRDALNGWDLVSDDYTAAVAAADYVVGVGDNVTFNTFVEQGVPKQRLKMLNYGVGQKTSQSTAKSNRFLYLASDIGLRKGFDIIASIFSHPAVLGKDFHLDIVGPIETSHYKARMKVLQELMKDKLTYHGWIGADSKKYDEVVSRATYLVFPALEEGQAGTILDGLRRGLIPISSQFTGVPFSPLGQLETSTSSATNISLILDALNVETAELKSLRQHAERYYQEFHANYLDNLSETVRNIATTGQLYPKISIVLPIFNKEHTIEGLLDNLDQSCLAYGNTEVNIIFDGCKDKTEKIVRKFYRDKTAYPVSYETTPNIFEVKSNNLGLKKSTGKYAAIIQDDNFIYDRSLFFETAMLLDNNPKIAILGGLAGVNFYPRGTRNLKGSGQIAMNKNEAYWRQDENTNKEFKRRYYEVDACMRGPLIFRKSFLEQHGYLDEAYAPFYMDDMDICFRARDLGYHVYTALFEVENLSQTVATYDTEERKKFWEDTMKRTSDIFYSRWTPSTKKDYDWIHRVALLESRAEAEHEAAFKNRVQDRNERRARKIRRRRRLLAPAGKAKRGVHAVARRVKNKIAS